ncbi:uncharacterized protein LTR77_001941 [Saxophila tyrrhenica]|uniref:C2H2-type domain-containing protein n=1 Tax=Saxophila tyrrhenica TaxID=1690608 RepID=A0AAV9PKA9_9PEZI|nr:hypothetical protein LTR77_001941 [Saxophila tyrrhenica]
MSFACPLCNDEFSDRTSLNEHTDATGHYHRCETCWSRFLDDMSLNEHAEATGHGLPPRYECETCDEMFASPIEVQEHMTAKRHHASQTANRLKRQRDRQRRQEKRLAARDAWKKKEESTWSLPLRPRDQGR